MPSPQHNLQHAGTDLKLHWFIVVIAGSMLAAYLLLCLSFGPAWQQSIPEPQRVMVRTIFYILTIIGFPLTHLIRHIQLRLNQTMPGEKSAKSRYLLTILISMSFAEAVGILGLVMFLLGDEVNTLYIFTLLSALAIYLYRPKMQEYLDILTALAEARR